MFQEVNTTANICKTSAEQQIFTNLNRLANTYKNLDRTANILLNIKKNANILQNLNRTASD